MTDIDINEIRKFTNQANNIGDFLKLNYKHIVEYDSFNQKIIEAAKSGESKISFDFVDSNIDEAESIKDVKFNSRRVYLSTKGEQAKNNMLDYPLYLISKGFKVNIRDAQKRHGTL